jgi:hypothetical protein
MWDEHLGGVLSLTGHASDGDARRRKLQLEDFRRSSDDKYTLAAPGFLYAAHRRQSGEVAACVCVSYACVCHCRGHMQLTLSHVHPRTAGAVRDIHSQDSIHNGKKLMNALDSASRALTLGNYTAHMNHVHLVFEKFGVSQHGLRANDVHRTDRQNWAACERLAMRRVQAALQVLIDQHSVPAQGTKAYLEVSTCVTCMHAHALSPPHGTVTCDAPCHTRGLTRMRRPRQVIWNYISVFFKREWSLRQRLEAASFVLHFLRLWRSWLLHHDTYTLKAHYISRECYEDITISVHQVALLIK